MKRIDILKSFAQEKQEEFSYSAMIRKIRKEHPDKIKSFLQAFKEAFDFGVSKNIDSIEQLALLQAIKTIGL